MVTERTMTLAEAAREARMDRQTVRRRLKAAGVEVEDYREGGPTGTIRIPTTVLAAADVPIGRPSPPDAPPQPSPQVEVLADLERAKARAQVAEAKVEALERLIEAKQDTIDAQAVALRMLGTGEPEERPRSRWLRR
jgi:hypothetical protein